MYKGHVGKYLDVLTFMILEEEGLIQKVEVPFRS